MRGGASWDAEVRFPIVKTVRGAVVETLRALHADESSGLDLAGLHGPMQDLRDCLVGKPISYGITITFPTGPHLHLRNTDLKTILTSVRNNRDQLAESITNYQGLTGVTPSKPGLRVLAMLIKSNSDTTTEQAACLKSIFKEALAIDLKSPAELNWRKDACLSIANIRTRITISIEPISTLERTLMKALKTDIPDTERDNRYAYRIKLDPETFTESLPLRLIKQLPRQVVACSTFFAPMVAAQYALSSSVLRSVLSSISSNAATQETIIHYLQLPVLAAVGTATFLAYKAIGDQRMLAQKRALELEEQHSTSRKA